MSAKTLWSQNKHIFISALSIFAVSLAVILFFTPGSDDYLKTDVLHAGGGDHGTDSGHAEETDHINYITLLDNKDYPYFVLDKDGKISFASDEFAKSLGVKAESLNGLFIFDLISQQHRERVFAHYRDSMSNKHNVSQTGPFRVEYKKVKNIMFMSFITVPDSEEVLIEVNDVTEDLQKIDKQEENSPLEHTEDSDETRVIVKNLVAQ